MAEQKIKVCALIPKPKSKRSEKFVRRINQLLKELNTEIAPISAENLDKLLSQQHFTLFVAVSHDGVVGMASLFILQTLSKKQGIVHDVVVGSAYRGQGIGEKLMQAIIDHARQTNLNCIDLTSRPERTAAHKLYEKLEFKKRDTRVYRLTLSK